MNQMTLCRSSLKVITQKFTVRRKKLVAATSFEGFVGFMVNSVHMDEHVHDVHVSKLNWLIVLV